MDQTNKSQSVQDNTLYSHKGMKEQIHISSVKIMDGEDLTAGNRRKLQQMQQKDWIDQQIKEKEERKRLEKEAQQAYEYQTLHINEMRKGLEENLNQKRRSHEQAIKQTNLQLMYSKVDYEKLQQDQEQQLNNQQIQYCTTNNFQTENTQTCQSQLAQHRVIPYHWKGMNTQQKNDILMEQEKQRCEAEKIAKAKQEEERLFALQTEHDRIMQINLDRARQKKLQETMQQTQEFNKLAANEQRNKIKNMYN